MEKKLIKDPFEKLYEQMDDLRKKKQSLIDDLMYGNLSEDAAQRVNDNIAGLKDELENLTFKENLLYKMAAKKDTPTEDLTTAFSLILPYKYYLTVNTVTCQECDLIALATNKVAYLINIYNGSEVVPLCENCLIKQKEKYERANQINTYAN